MKHIFISVSWCLLAFGCLNGQPYEPFFHHLTVEDGLSDGTNDFITLDSRGFVWLSSLNGLNRFDGRTVKVYQPDEDTPGSMYGQNIQSALYEEENGDLWFTTYGGLNRYDRAQDTFEYFLIPSRSVDISYDYYAFHLDGHRNLWLLHGWEDVYQFNLDTRRFQKLFTLEQPARRAAVSEDGKGNVRRIWAHSLQDAGLNMVTSGPDKGYRQELLFHQEDNGFFIRHVLPAGDSMIWLATSKGLYQYFPDNRRISLLEDSRDLYINSIGYYDSKTMLTVVKDAGLGLFSRETGKLIRFIEPDLKDANSLSSEDLGVITNDQYGGLWISTLGAGVDYCFPAKQKFSVIEIGVSPDVPGLPAKPQSLIEDDYGQVWCGTKYNGIYVLNRENQLIAHHKYQTGVPNTLPEGEIINLCKLKNGHICILTWNGVTIWEPEKKIFRQLPDFNKSFIYAYCLDNGQILLTAVDGGIYELNEKSQSIREVGNTGNAAAFSSLWQDSKGRLFGCRELSYIWVMDPENDYKLIKRIELSGETDAYYESPEDGTFWLANSYGLYGLNSDLEIIAEYGEEEGLPGSTVYGLVPDYEGKLWLSTNRGLAVFNPATRDIQRFSLADGLPSIQFNRQSFLRRSNGECWFGTAKGIAIVEPRNIEYIKVEANPRLIEILINGEKPNDLICSKTGSRNITEIERIELGSQENTLSFRFAPLEYSDPSSTRFRYRLYDQDKNWVNAGTQNTTRYTKIPPGEFTFQLQAANSDGYWGHIQDLAIYIQPPFYQTWWFYSLSGAAVIGILWFIAWMRNQRRKRIKQIEEDKREALEQERQRIARDVHDDLGSSLSALNIRTELARYKPSADLPLEIEKINDSARELSGKIREVIWTVSARNDTLSNLISYMQQYAQDLLEDNDLEIYIALPDHIPEKTITGEHRRTTFLAYKEALNNIIKHAGATKVNIQFKTSPEELIIIVEDNGKGFDRALLQTSRGNGLRNMRSRMQDIGGDCEFLPVQQGTCIRFTVTLAGF